ncbi:hypothetical protein [Staphylococcus equorum]|uniref:hypothetical protein n=1 Tax=Staphylococcus equorum TaxID=246432 RepID=UPI0015B64078|nr:hypothetical protein [Staphylococcus equorum]
MSTKAFLLKGFVLIIALSFALPIAYDSAIDVVTYIQDAGYRDGVQLANELKNL